MVIDNGEEEGWGADIRLSITNITDTDSTGIYTAVSSYENRNLGLVVVVPHPKKGGNGFGQGFVLKSMGEESDYLIKVLRKLYHQQKDTSAHFVDHLTVNYVNLDQFAVSNFGKEGEPYTTASNYKLFFEWDKSEEYAELYLNVDLQEKWIEIREKDEEYRPAVIKFLTNQ